MKKAKITDPARGKWLSTSEATALLETYPRHIRRMAERGEIPHRYVDGKGRGGRVLEVFISAEKVPNSTKDKKGQQGDGAHPFHTHGNNGSPRKTKDMQPDPPDALQPTDTSNHIAPFQPVGSLVGTVRRKDEVAPTTFLARDYAQSLDWVDAKGVGTVLSISRRAAHKKATAHDWPHVRISDANCRERVYYPVSCLPMPAQVKWREMQMERWRPELPALQKQEQMEWQALSNRARETARAKHLFVLEYRESVALGRQKGRKIANIDKAFENALNKKNILQEQQKTLGGRVSISSIRRWDKILRDAKQLTYPVALATARMEGRPTVEVDAESIRAHLYNVVRMGLDLSKAYAEIVSKEWNGVELISYSTFVRMCSSAVTAFYLDDFTVDYLVIHKT